MLRWSTLAFVAIVGCDDGGDAPDAMPPADATAESDPASPEPPELPLLTPCPEGWPERERSDQTFCHPFIDSVPLCPAGQAHFPGEVACAPIGAPCPSGAPDPFPKDVPTTAVVYAWADAAPGGDGTRSAPFSSVGQALAAADRGATVVVGPGEYDVVLSPRNDVVVRGACVEQTRFAPTFGPGGAVVVVDGVQLTLRDLTIAATVGPAINARGAGAVVRLDGVSIDGAIDTGIAMIDGATLEATALAVRGARLGGRGFGRGISFDRGATGSLSRVLLIDNMGAGLFVARGSGAAVTDAVIAATLPRSTDLRFGRGITVQADATFTLERALVVENKGVGIYAAVSASLGLEDVVVERTGPRASDLTTGRGVEIWDGASATGRRLAVIDGGDNGIIASEPMTTLSLEDAVVMGMSGTPVDPRGIGLSAQNGATLDATRVLIADSLGTASLLGGAVATLRDVSIRGTRTSPTSPPASRAMQISDAATVTMERAAMIANDELGIVVAGESTRLTASDLMVRDTSTDPRGRTGRGLSAQDRAVADLTRADLSFNRSVGLLYTAEATGEVADLTVLSTAAAECTVSDGCAETPAGVGLATIGGGARVSRFVVRDAALCGVYVDAVEVGRGLDLVDGLIEDSVIGACVRGSYDVERLSTDVRYRNNGTNLDSTDLPIPTTTEVIPSSGPG